MALHSVRSFLSVTPSRHFTVATCLLAAAVCLQAGAQTAPSTGSGRSKAWVATWGTAMLPVDSGNAPDVTGKTLREVVHTSVAGNRARVWISNRFGSTSLYIGAAHIALTAVPEGASLAPTSDLSAIQPGSDQTLTFNHAAAVTIPPGAEIVSDPVSMQVPAFSDVSVSLYLPRKTMVSTEHSYADQSSYVASGDEAASASLTDPKAEKSWFFVSGLDVSSAGKSAVVAFGDSITDGAYATMNENRRWPDDLAQRLAADAATRRAGVLGVVNSGIGGNRVLLNGWGPDALSRINSDIIARSGARYVIVLESINDIGRFVTDRQPYGDLAQRLEFGLEQIATQAHAHGMRVIGATLTPYQGCGYYSPAGDKVRMAVNDWIRHSGVFDGVADFAKATRDPNNPQRFAPQFDSGDHLHPNNAGYKAMADSIDLSLFTKSH